MPQRHEAISEEWRPIPSAPGYFASNEGRIRDQHGHIVYQNRCRKYFRVSLNKRKRTCAVSRLICEAFHGAPPTQLHQAAHGNGNTIDNSPQNLRWATAKENKNDQILHGTFPIGSKIGTALLDEEKVAEIRNLYSLNMGKSYVKRGIRTQLAQKFKVATKTIDEVVSRERWRHV